MTDTPTTPGDPTPGQVPLHPPAGGQAVPPGWAPPPGYAPPGYFPPAPPSRPSGRWRKLAVGMGAAAGVAVGAAALAGAATSGGATPTDATATASGSTSTTPSTTTPKANGPNAHRHFFGPAAGPLRGGLGGIMGAYGGIGGPAIYGQETVSGPNGYETIAQRSGTVSDVSDTSGSTWSLTVKSADGTSGTFTVDASTSVNGGEMGIGSVKSGDTVTVVALVSGSTSTAKQVTDETVLKANGNTWRPMGPMAGPMGGSSSSSGSTSSSGSST